MWGKPKRPRCCADPGSHLSPRPEPALSMSMRAMSCLNRVCALRRGQLGRGLWLKGTAWVHRNSTWRHSLRYSSNPSQPTPLHQICGRGNQMYGNCGIHGTLPDAFAQQKNATPGSGAPPQSGANVTPLPLQPASFKQTTPVTRRKPAIRFLEPIGHLTSNNNGRNAVVPASQKRRPWSPRTRPHPHEGSQTRCSSSQWEPA